MTHDCTRRRFLGTVAAAEATGGTITIENHSSSLLQKPEGIRRFAELATPDCVGVALAPDRDLHAPGRPAVAEWCQRQPNRAIRPGIPPVPRAPKADYNKRKELRFRVAVPSRRVQPPDAALPPVGRAS
jgi:hypothetical protein